jgi:hypothetical protein
MIANSDKLSRKSQTPREGRNFILFDFDSYGSEQVAWQVEYKPPLFLVK